MGNGLNKRSRLSDLICMLPAFIFVLSILLVRLHLFSMPLSDIYWTEALNTSTLADLFSYWKSIAIITAGCLGIAFLVFGYVGDQVRFKKSFLYIPALVYIAFVLLSLAFSKYKYFAIHGMQEHFEGTFVLLAYIMMVFFLYNTVDSERRAAAVIFCALGAALLLGILGITQATGHDFFTTAAGQKIMTPNYDLESGVKSWDMIDILADQGKQMYSFSFTAGEVYQTVYNINYVPLYLSLLIPTSAVLFLYYWTKDEKPKLAVSAVFLVLYGLMLYNLFAANSASGYFGLAALFIALLIVFRKKITKWIKPLICLIVVLGLVMALLTDRWLPELTGKAKAAASHIIERIYAENGDTVQYDFENDAGMTWYPVDYIETLDEQLVFGINGGAVVFTRDDSVEGFIVTDENGEELQLRIIEGKESEYEILDNRFHDYVKVQFSKEAQTGRSVIMLTTRAYTWLFPYDEDGFIYRNKVGKEVKLIKVPHSGLIKNLKFGSNRGLIWADTIPILHKYCLVGAGADTFPFVYPQNDYASIYSTSMYIGLVTVTDKAHNLFMQYWVNTGLISLLAWLAMVGFYFVGAAKQFRKRGFEDFCDFVNGGIFCGIIGFLAVAFFNDGSVNTMPMFYTMLGIGLAINARDMWPGAVAAETGHNGTSKNTNKKRKG